MKNNSFTTSRLTGIFYLGLAITGMMAFLFARQKLYIENDAIATITNFIQKEGLTRFGIAAELALVSFQSLSALWFYKLFKKVNSFLAIALATFGTINAVIILIASAFWLSSLYLSPETAHLNPEQTALAYSIFNLHETVWIVGKLFFGLWLIPMGILVKSTKMPQILGWILITGGFGYTLSLFLQILVPTLSASTLELITIPATIGEFWMIGYLLFKKVKL